MTAEQEPGKDEAGAAPIAPALELCGLGVVGLGLFQGLATGDVKRELLMMALGAAIFTAGWAVRKGGAAGAAPGRKGAGSRRPEGGGSWRS